MEYQFKIQIKGISKPPVWRKVIVPANFTFLQFHSVIQTVFGWEDYHLFEFEDKEYQGSIRIAIPSEDDFDFGVKTLDASKVKLSEYITPNVPLVSLTNVPDISLLNVPLFTGCN